MGANEKRDAALHPGGAVMPSTTNSDGHAIRVLPRRKPSSETGIFMHQHKHDWYEIGAERWPVGSWHPVFRCLVCGDVICDLDVEVSEPAAPEPSNSIIEENQ